MKSNRFIFFLTCFLLVFYFVISETIQGSNEFSQAIPDNEMIQDESELMNRYLTFPYNNSYPETYCQIPDSRICFLSESKSEFWKGLVKSHTFFTNIYLRKISIYLTETDLLFSNKTILTIFKIVQDEPLLFLRI